MEKTRLTQANWEYLLSIKDKNIFKSRTDDAAFVENLLFPEDFFYSDSLSISFRHCEFEGNASFHACRLQSPMFLRECVFRKDCYMGELTSTSPITILDCSIGEAAMFVECAFPRLDLNLKYAKKIIFSDSSAIEHIDIGGKDRNPIGNLHINLGTNLKRLEINHVDIEDLFLGYSTLDTELIIANAFFHKVTLDNFRNAGSLKLQNCRANDSNASIVINRTNLGNAEFFHVDFSTFSEINITNTVLYECIFINCIWSWRNMISRVEHFSTTLDMPEEKTPRRLAENRRDVFKQVKTAYAHQGDYVQEQFFHGLEMNAYNKSLSYRTDLWTKVILRLSFWTSNYGQSFIRPLVLIFSVNALLYLGMFQWHATEFSSVDFRHSSSYVNAFASLLNFISPLHKQRDNLSGFPVILDIVSRIVSSYLIYNLIRATRRFVK